MTQGGVYLTIVSQLKENNVNKNNFHTALYMAQKSKQLYLRELNKNPSSSLSKFSDSLPLILYKNVNNEYNFYSLDMLLNNYNEESLNNCYLGLDDLQKSIFNYNKDDYKKYLSALKSLYYSNKFNESFNLHYSLDNKVNPIIDWKTTKLFDYKGIKFPEYNLLKVNESYYYFILTNDPSYKSFTHLCDKYGLHYLLGILKIAINESFNVKVFPTQVNIIFMDKESPNAMNIFNTSSDNIANCVDYSINIINNWKVNSKDEIINTNVYNLEDDLSLRLRPE